jgi:heme/copper-type cytochrome/quinol oxidase subunit 3
MAITSTEHEEPQDDGRHVEAVAGHHETHEQRDFKERVALYLFIGGDAIFLLLELFTWFYLRQLNTNGLWRGAACTKAKACVDGLGNPITQEIPKASPWFTVVIAVLVVMAAGTIWLVERAIRNNESRKVSSMIAGLAAVVLLAAVVVQCIQFGHLPFTTIDGTYASTFIYFMGSTLAHIALLFFIALGLWIRVRGGRYEYGNWYQPRLMRMFAVWTAASACVLAIVMTLFA